MSLQDAQHFIFEFPPSLWKQKIHQTQLGHDCSGIHTPLGLINDLILPPDYKSWLSPEELANLPTGPFSKFRLDSVTGPDFVSTSAKDFTLRYTISVDRDHRK
jgi:hypothetical protein